MGNEESKQTLDDKTAAELAASSKFPKEEVERIFEQYKKRKTISNRKELIEILDRLGLLDDVWKAMKQISSERATAEVKPANPEVDKIVADALHDKKQTELRELLGEQVFRGFDVNGDGQVSFQELIGGLAVLLHGERTDHVQLLFRVLDRDQSGFIDRKELVQYSKFFMSGFRTGMVIGIHSQREKMQAAGMKESDFDHVIEIVDAWAKDPKVLDVIVDSILTTADKDKDGKITPAEYSAWYTSDEIQKQFHEQLQKALAPSLQKMSQQLAMEILKLAMRVVKRNR